jgi:protein-S-isoprenylcysteine O-methyltransferase Ste14
MKNISKKDIFFVGTQLVLFLFYVIPTPAYQLKYDSKIAENVFFIITLSGILLIGISLLLLNKNLTPFPSPKQNSELIKTGVYKIIRHPIYTGLIMTTFFYALYSHSLLKIVIAIILFILFYFKSKYEEILLCDKFPEYYNYSKNTYRFFPFIL